MKVSTQPPETDLILPTPDGADWDGLTIHTHYFGFSIPQQALSAFIYLRAQPVYGLCSGGVCLFRGLDNQRPLDCEHIDYRNTMPWPTMTANSFTTQNGLRIEFTEPGSAVDVSYRSIERDVSFDLRLTAITSLLVRGHVMPGEERDSVRAAAPGGSEQFMHCTGTLTLGEANYSVDCYPIRDRSWRQVRTEAPNDYPPVGWTPMCFGPDLMFNQVGFEDPAGDPPPIWKSHFTLPADGPLHYFGYVVVDGEERQLTSVQRTVLERHPDIGGATRQVVVARDEVGVTHIFHGEALAMAHLPSWPNNTFIDSLYRWTDAVGRVAHCTYQETWYQRFQHVLKTRRTHR